MLTRRGFLKGLLGTALAGLGLGGYGIGTAALDLHIRGYRLSPPGWRAGGLRIVVLADLHASDPTMGPERIGRIVDRANDLGGDLIVLLGDFRAAHRFQRGRLPYALFMPQLARLKAPLGVFAIAGNHDWWEDAAALARRAGPLPAVLALEEAGITVLVNRALPLRGGAGAFWLAGVDSTSAFHLSNPEDWIGASDLSAALADIPPGSSTILLAHEPDLFARVRPPVALQLSGHTHGGQINLFGWRPIVPSAYGARYALGHFREEGRDLVVSGGLGCSGLPLRIGVRPEITLVDLA